MTRSLRIVHRLMQRRAAHKVGLHASAFARYNSGMFDTVLIRPARPSDVKAIARVHIEGWHTAYSGFIPDSYLSTLNYEEDCTSFREWLFHTAPAPVSQVAIHAGQVIGFVVAGPNTDEVTRPYDAEIHKLFVRPEYQGQGTGRRLLHAACFDLLQKGFRSVVLWAYSAGRSVGFYQSLGGEAVYQTSQRAGDKDLAVQVFGWSLRDLCQRTEP
jgi:ribosomal protein S18 acetylase RimI-like enzyme